MWHEARKQERRIRGLIVDYRRRAERRQDFYEKIQADPTQFIQIHGRRCKIHLDPALAAAGDGAAIIVPWQGQHDNLIDRFDVRAHLDYIPAIPKVSDSEIDISQEERQCNYERYRILAQNDFLNVPEEKFLHQLYLEEQFGANAPLEGQGNQGKKKSQKSGAAIGYSYDDSTDNAPESQQPFAHLKHPKVVGGLAGIATVPSASISNTKKTENESDSESDSDMDMDVSIEVSKLDTNQAHELNACGRNYGMLSNDFYSYLTKDADEADALRLAREEEREKILLGGRKSRRERRAQKERRIARRPFSPPSYAAKEDKIGKDEESDSRSPSPSDTTEKITYITSFGGEDELQPHSKITITLGKGSSTLGAACVGASTSAGSGQTTYAQKVKENLEKLKQINTFSKKRDSRSRSYSRSRSHSRSRRRSRRSARKSRSRSTSYKRHRKIDKRSFSHSRSRSRSVNKPRSFYSRRHKEYYKRSRTRSPLRSHSKSRPRRRRYSSSSSSSINRSSVSPLRTNYKSTRRTKCSPKNTTLSRHRSRSSSHSISRHIKTTSLKEKSESPRKAILVETHIGKETQIASTSPLKTILTIPPQSVHTPMETLVTKQSSSDVNVIEPPPPPLKRYYGRKKDEYSSSENNSESDNNDGENMSQIIKTRDATDNQDIMDVDTTSEKSNPLPSTSISSYKGKSLQQPQQTGKYGSNTTNSNAPETKGSSGIGTGASGSSGRLNLRERLKRKMQNLLNKQYKADKKAEIEKTERERQLQQEREEEMRELSIKLRRRQRELRHRYGSQNSKESESDISDMAIATKCKRSKSHSSERSIVKKIRNRSREPKRRSPLTIKRSSSRERRRSPSRSRHPRSRSQSRTRRSNSRRRRRSVSRSRRRREPSCERSSRYTTERSHYDNRQRRSTSRNERERERDRDRERDRARYRDRDRDSDRQRYWGSSGTSDRYHSNKGSDGRERSDKDRHNRDHRVGESQQSVKSATTSRSRVVISAPPKLKKLVDY